MKKTLILLAHPAIANSKANKAWANAAAQHPERFTIHDIYQAYPHWQIDVAKEQALIEAHDALVLQFPIYWFNCPPLLKKWIDDVLSYGWAYGNCFHLENKPLGIAVTAGGLEQNYQNGIPLETLLTPFAATVYYIRAQPAGIFSIYGVGSGTTDAQIQASAKAYVTYLDSVAAKSSAHN